MHDHVAIIHDNPAVARQALFFALLMMFGAHIVQRRVGECVQHAVAGAGTDDEIICEGNHILDVDQDDILALFIFEGIYDFTCEFERIQESPLLEIALWASGAGFNFAENNLV